MKEIEFFFYLFFSPYAWHDFFLLIFLRVVGIESNWCMQCMKNDFVFISSYWLKKLINAWDAWIIFFFFYSSVKNMNKLQKMWMSYKKIYIYIYTSPHFYYLQKCVSYKIWKMTSSSFLKAKGLVYIIFPFRKN